MFTMSRVIKRPNRYTPIHKPVWKRRLEIERLTTALFGSRVVTAATVVVIVVGEADRRSRISDRIGSRWGHESRVRLHVAALDAVPALLYAEFALLEQLVDLRCQLNECLLHVEASLARRLQEQQVVVVGELLRLFHRYFP